jgi:hypothetical protein
VGIESVPEVDCGSAFTDRIEEKDCLDASTCIGLDSDFSILIRLEDAMPENGGIPLVCEDSQHTLRARQPAFHVDRASRSIPTVALRFDGETPR